MTPAKIDHELFKRGIPLSQAFYAFADAKKSAEYQKLLPRAFGLNVMLNQLSALTKYEVPEELRLSAAELSAHNKLGDALKRQGLNWLIDGQLIGYGYAQPRAPDDLPQHIPPDLWTTRLNWSSDTVKQHGLEFQGVRIFHPAWLQTQAAAPVSAAVQTSISISPNVEARPMGRPPSKPIIQDAYRQCREQKLIKPGMQRSHAIQVVQKFIKSNFPSQWGKNGRGFGKEVVRQVIAEGEGD